MAATQIVTAHIEGLENQSGTIGTLAIRDLAGAVINSSGYVSPNLKTLRLRHASDVKRIKGQKGLTTGLLANDEMVECTFDFIMEGTTKANSRLSARLPAVLACVDIANLPVIILGTFTDVLNNAATTGTPWIYEGEGSINGESEDVWSGTMTLRRYVGIPTWSIIS